MEADYSSQPYFWEQQSYVERPFRRVLENRTEHNFFQKNPNAEPTQRHCAFKVLSLFLPLACAQPTHVYLHKYLHSFVIFAFGLLFSMSFKV